MLIIHETQFLNEQIVSSSGSTSLACAFCESLSKLLTFQDGHPEISDPLAE